MAKKSSFTGWIITVLLVGGLAAGGWWFWQGKAEKPAEFVTIKAARGEITQAVTATGDLQAVTSVEVSSLISGLITDIMVDFNSPVKEGQVLAKLDPATYNSRLRQSEAELTNTRANHQLVKLNSDRVQSLFERKLVSQQELDQAQAQLAQADAQLLIRQAAVENAKVDLGRCTIYAPIDGIVIDRQAEVGRTVASSLNAPTLFIIVNDLAKMQIKAAVAEADIGSVAEGQEVNFTVDAYPNRQFRGRVSQIRNSPVAAQNVVVYSTIIDVDNADLKLKPGMTANVSIVVARRPDTIRVANSALRARVPEELILKPAPTPVAADAKGGTPAAAPAPMTEEERRTAMREIMREAGFQPGGPPSADVMAKARQIAQQRGIELPENFGTRGGGGGGGGGRRNAAAGAPSDAPVTRTVYRLVGTGPAARAEPVTVRLGITDGLATEVMSGLNEGDELVTSVIAAGSTSTSARPAAAANPFGGGGRRF